MRDVAQVLQARVGRGHAEDLVVAAGLVGHPEHADRAAADQAAGEGGLLEDHQGVERVAVQAQGVLDVAVVGRVLGRGEQRPVQADPAGLVVDLVLVALTLGDLHQHVELEHVILRHHLRRPRRGARRVGRGPVSRTMTPNVESARACRVGRRDATPRPPGSRCGCRSLVVLAVLAAAGVVLRRPAGRAGSRTRPAAVPPPEGLDLPALAAPAAGRRPPRPGTPTPRRYAARSRRCSTTPTSGRTSSPTVAGLDGTAALHPRHRRGGARLDDQAAHRHRRAGGPRSRPHVRDPGRPRAARAGWCWSAAATRCCSRAAGLDRSWPGSRAPASLTRATRSGSATTPASSPGPTRARAGRPATSPRAWSRRSSRSGSTGAATRAGSAGSPTRRLAAAPSSPTRWARRASGWSAYPRRSPRRPAADALAAVDRRPARPDRRAHPGDQRQRGRRGARPPRRPRGVRHRVVRGPAPRAIARRRSRTSGVPVRGAEVYDGSGLSRDNRIDPDTLTAVLQRGGRGRPPRAAVRGRPGCRSPASPARSPTASRAPTTPAAAGCAPRPAP